MIEEFRGTILSREIVNNPRQYPSKECVIKFVGDNIKAEIAVVTKQNIRTLEQQPLHKTCSFALHNGEYVYVKILSGKKHRQKVQQKTKHLYSVKQVEHALKNHTNLGHYSVKKFPDDDMVVYYDNKYFGNFTPDIVRNSNLFMLGVLVRDSIDAYARMKNRE